MNARSPSKLKACSNRTVTRFCTVSRGLLSGERAASPVSPRPSRPTRTMRGRSRAGFKPFVAVVAWAGVGSAGRRRLRDVCPRPRARVGVGIADLRRHVAHFVELGVTDVSGRWTQGLFPPVIVSGGPRTRSPGRRHMARVGPVYEMPVSRPRARRHAPRTVCLNGVREQGFGPSSGCANLVRAVFTVVLQRLPGCLLSATRLSPSPTGSTRRLRR